MEPDSNIISIHRDTWEALKRLKTHPRQSFNEVIADLIAEHREHAGPWAATEDADEIATHLDAAKREAEGKGAGP